ncbi:hypothetical protein HPP92_009128 [Vanilla planifolia]|uniref:Uncharacterized protein n=1 Tax=Vanilla planifolia TaxID=51239 RepID=A0A835V2K4_VANPL|nr:hypothetical protein HPP92_009128 [Vanilla planifolia]
MADPRGRSNPAPTSRRSQLRRASQSAHHRPHAPCREVIPIARLSAAIRPPPAPKPGTPLLKAIKHKVTFLTETWAATVMAVGRLKLLIQLLRSVSYQAGKRKIMARYDGLRFRLQRTETVMLVLLRVCASEKQRQSSFSLQRKFWPNNKSRMYILENTGEFVRSHDLHLGDFIMLFKDDEKDRYVILRKKAANGGQETCLASANPMPFDLLKRKLMSRLEAMGVRILKIYEEEWSYIPVGGSLPNTEQKNLAFGAAASMVHPATGYSVVRSLSEAPNYASVIANILKRNAYNRENGNTGRSYNPSAIAWRSLWPQEKKRQRAFFLFGLALILQLDIEEIRIFFQTFFRLPDWMWQGFLASSLSSMELIWFSFYMFVIAPNSLRMCLLRHLLSDPTGTTMIRTYLNL